MEDNVFDVQSPKIINQPNGDYTSIIRSSLNYREFLTKIVKFKKVVEFDQVQTKAQQDDQGCSQGKSISQIGAKSYSVEERIHINYRLQYLKDTVMARYIDDQAVNFINQIIMGNNREIVMCIFGLNSSSNNQGMLINQQESQTSLEQTPSLKDQIFDKIVNMQDISTRHQAIEFMIELCQILKNLQIQPGGLGGGPANFFGATGGMSGASSVNSRQLYEQLNEQNFIGILALTFNILIPSQNSLGLHIQLQDAMPEEVEGQRTKLFEEY